MNLTSLARPYARAAFEIALSNNALSAWEIFLRDAAFVSEDPRVLRLMKHHSLNEHQLEKFFQEVLAKELDTEKKNFIRLLAENKRFPLLREIAEQFKKRCDLEQKQMAVEVESAVALTAEQKEKLIRALTKRFKLQVSLNASVNPELLGGALIRAGDVVIDGSLRGKLNRLVDFIS